MYILRNNLLWSQAKELAFSCVFLIFFNLFMFSIYGLYLYLKVAGVVALFFFFCLYFFRNPKRVCQAAVLDSAVIVSPADGVIVDIQRNNNEFGDRYIQKISIFLSPLDVHVNWVPFNSTINQMTYKSGKFMCAFLPKSSEFNERHDVEFKRDSKGGSVLVRQIAGTVARRICWWVDMGARVCVGDTFGMIRFGSRVDIFLPAIVTLTVSEGQRVHGGETVLGVWQ